MIDSMSKLELTSLPRDFANRAGFGISTASSLARRRMRAALASIFTFTRILERS